MSRSWESLGLLVMLVLLSHVTVLRITGPIGHVGVVVPCHGLSVCSFLFIGVARILSGVHFFGQKVDDLFSRHPQRPSKYTSKSKPPSKNCPKISSKKLTGGALRVSGGGYTYTFSL